MVLSWVSSSSSSCSRNVAPPFKMLNQLDLQRCSLRRLRLTTLLQLRSTMVLERLLPRPHLRQGITRLCNDKGKAAQ
jgi:hypothetical protein